MLGWVGVRLDWQSFNATESGGSKMSESVYRVTEVVGVSSDSWEQAARNAVEKVGETVRDLRVAEVTREDLTIVDGKVSEFRVRLSVSFKYDRAQ